MSSTGDKIIDFQAGVGKFGADVGIIGAYIFAGILIITAVILAVLALTPTEPIGCSMDISQDEFNSKTTCDRDPTSSECTKAKHTLEETKKRCEHKTRKWFLLFFLLLIPLGVGIVYFAKWNRKMVERNRAMAAVEGTATEIGILKDVLSNYRGFSSH